MPPKKTGSLLESNMKFNLRLFVYLFVYLLGSTVLLAQQRHPVLIALFGFIGIITVMLIRLKPKLEAVKTEMPPLTPRGQAMQKELEMAHRVQQALLSSPPPVHPSIKITGRCDSAHSVGGDFFCFTARQISGLQEKERKPGIVSYVGAREECIGIAIGDVAGHGVSSALVMALSSGLISEISQGEHRAAVVLSKANTQILKYIENSQVPYVTCAFASFFPSQRKLSVSLAGHPPVFILHAEGRVSQLNTKGVFLGMFPNENYEEISIILEPGDKVVFYTDGIVETRNINNEEFGLDRLISVIQSHKNLELSALMDTVFANVTEFGEAQKDDRTMVLLEVL